MEAGHFLDPDQCLSRQPITRWRATIVSAKPWQARSVAYHDPVGELPDVVARLELAVGAEAEGGAELLEPLLPHRRHVPQHVPARPRVGLKTSKGW